MIEVSKPSGTTLGQCVSSPSVREGVAGREGALPHARATATPRGDGAKLVNLGLVMSSSR
jgi:hypothetical protein